MTRDRLRNRRSARPQGLSHIVDSSLEWRDLDSVPSAAAGTLRSAHPEGLRERPCEVPATATSLRLPAQFDRTGERTWRRCQIRPDATDVPGQMRRRNREHCRDRWTARSSRPPGPREGAFGNAVALACRECGHQVGLGPFYACPECFGPLEVAYESPRSPARRSRRAPATSGATRRCCRCPTDIEESPNMEPGLHPAPQGATTSARARHREPLGQGRLAPTRPTPSRTGWSPVR